MDFAGVQVRHFRFVLYISGELGVPDGPFAFFGELILRAWGRHFGHSSTFVTELRWSAKHKIDTPHAPNDRENGKNRYFRFAEISWSVSN